MDVKTTFFNGQPDGEIYIEQSDGFEVEEISTKCDVCNIPKWFFKQSPMH